LPRKVRNLVTLKLNEESSTYIRSNFWVNVNVRIYYTNKDSLSDSTDYVFAINYDTTGGAKYNSKRLFTFNNAYKVTTKILSITDSFPSGVTAWNVIPLLRLENEMQIERYYNFVCASYPSSFFSYVTGSDLGQLWVFYSKIDGITEYDFEWTFIDSVALRDTSLYGNFDNPDLVRIFDAGATRVTTTAEMYKIPLLFDNSGYIFSRVRGVKVLPGGQRIEGKWCTEKTPAQFNRYYFAGHERKFNWQSTISFAEEGKLKSVVQYADGSLRGRQTVTKDNASQNILVAETFYDYQGRPTIQVLPAPKISNLIGFVYDFNKSISGGEYEKSLYDSLINYCNTGAPAMSSTGSGANYYYSSNFGYATVLNIHKALPKAYGYAFAETRYSQDNTGRISMQSGVGDQHQIGGGHETKYFYGKPDQKELDALFGTEAGDASHYQKNMVRDANGQYSVSYVDMHGRTVATALAGKPTAKLDSLESYNEDIITKNLSDPQSAVISGMSMSSSSGLVVTKASTHFFHYTLQPDSLQLQACDSSQICYDCVYNLEISISDECNNQQLPNQTRYVLLDSNFTLGSFDTSCGNVIPGFDTTFSVYLTEGSYTISKKLSVSRAGFEYYRDSVFLKKNLCKTFEEFYNEALTAIQNQDCQPSCDSCLAQLGTYEQFRHNYMEQNGIDSATQLSQYESQIQVAYGTAKEGCDILCDSVSVLSDIREMMLADMTPESGQYANPDPLESSYQYNIFYRKSLGAPYNFQNIGSGYYVDENGKRDSIYNSSGQLVPPNHSSIAQEQFIAQFKPSWAKTLLPQHPEYCRLNLAEQLRLSYIWDQNFENTETYAEAKAKGYLNPVGLTGYGFLPSVSGGADPLSTLNTTLYNSLKTKAQYYRQNGATWYSIWGIATATSH
ncbi:MAG TPA: hypothetical protein VI461_09150, partial [Chitinophagaceae bacterium]|nr:hypothetical protein [Chitinophagaceae bacterium]